MKRILSSHKDNHYIPLIKRMPTFEKFKHPKTVRHATAIGIGFCICLIGSYMATFGASQHLVAHFVWDAISYSIHAVGLGPILAHIEPLWAILLE